MGILRRWFRRAHRRTAGCRACGVCCDLFGHALRAVAEDLERWKAEGRRDLLLRVGKAGVIWCDPATGRHLDDCPFVVRSSEGAARCRVHHTKPAVCRDYPTRAHRYRCVRGVRFDG